MNARRMMIMALFVMGTVTVIAAGSALADPANINVQPTEDWFFDSGDSVVIAYRTWDINYNITVANDTLLAFDECVFTFSDPAELYSRWIDVWWNGSMIINNCTFKSTGNAKYYIMVENTTTIQSSTISGMKAPWSSAGGITAWDCSLTFRNTDIMDNEGVAVWAENCNLIGDGLTVTNSGNENTDGAGFMAVYTYNDYMDTYVLFFQDSQFSDNVGRGFGLRAYMNWADIMAEFNGCSVERNGQRGLDIYWGRDGSYDNTNASLDLIVQDCYFSENYWDGLRYNQYDVERDGTAFVNITVDGCTFFKVRGSGMFMNVYYGDQTFNIIVNDCDFIENSQGGRAGLALTNQYVWSAWNAEVTNCRFSDNYDIGLHIDHRTSDVKGSTYLIKDCTFKNHTDSLYIYNNDGYGEFFNDFLIEGCDFSGSEGAGIHNYIEWAGIPIEIVIRDCNFENSDGSGIRATSSNYGSVDALWDIDDCTFEDLGGFAIDVMIGEVMTGATLDIANCMINDTGGIRFVVMTSWSSVSASNMLKVENVDVTETHGPAIDALIYGYYGTDFNVYLKDVTVDVAIYDGIKALAGSNYLSTSHSINMDVSVMDVTVSNVEGNGLYLGTGQIEYRGERLLDVNNLEVSQTQRAVTASGLKGEFMDTTITGSSREDFMFIGTNVELYEPNLDSLDEGTVLIIESGSAKIWYRLNVKVEWDTGQWVDKAVVEIMDNHHALIGIETQVNPSGLPELFLNSFQFRETGMFTRSPYLLNVTFNAINERSSVHLDMNKAVTIKIQDHVAPKVFINEPLSDHVQQSTSINVRGSSFDSESLVKMVEVSIDGIDWIDSLGTTSWSHTFTVSHQDVIDNGGMFTVRARAWDFANNSAITLTTVEVDPFPPELRIDFPSNNYQTNMPTIDVRGVTEAGATVLVNGMETQVVGTLFSTDVDLVEGPNTITVTAFDMLGNAQSIKMEVVLDTKAPYVVLLTPEDNEMFTEATCLVSGQAEEGLVISVNGAILTSGQYNNGTFSYVLSLDRGVNMVVVEATDAAGNHLIIGRSVTLDDVMPILAIQSPGMEKTYQSDLIIMVIGTTDPDSFVLINDELVTLDHGLFTHAIVGIVGTNLIEVQAMDLAGNQVTTSLTVEVDLESPLVDITRPEEDIDIVTSSDYVLEGTTVGAKSIDVNGDVYAIDEILQSFSIPVTLLEGANRFVLTIEDEAGNSVATERLVYLDTIPPALVVRISDLQENSAGDAVYKTEKGKPATMTITGFTDDAIQIRINGELVPVSTEGYFVLDYSLNVKVTNAITITAVDKAGNEASWNENIIHTFIKEADAEGFSWGYLVLILGLVLLIFAIVAGWWRLSKTTPEMEMRAVEEDEVLAPAAMPEVEEEEDLEDEEEEEEIVIDEEEEEVHELAPPTERPRTETSRPDSGPSEDVTIEIDEKDLEEKDADAEIGADDTDQEGI